MTGTLKAMDGMTAAAVAAYALSDAAVIFPITPASHMAETVERWASEGRLNFFGQTVDVKEMQSEKGVAGALHGVLAGGGLGTTITDSQGLMLMIPNMYKISGENLPGVFHVTTRSLSAHALSIFGDHQDIMAVRQTGVAMLGSSSVQDCLDLSLVAHLSAIEGSLPFVHFFDGFRTSDEVETIEVVDAEAMRPLVNWDAIRAFRARAMEPERPAIRGTAQNPDIYFQNREAANPLYDALPGIVQANMDKVAALTGRQYHLFDYVGAPDAERVVVTMASSCDVVDEVVRYLTARGEKVGLVKVRLFRPFSAEHLLAALPASTRVVTALDRTKEPGSQGEPLFQDVALAVLGSGRDIAVLGGRYGLSSKDFTPTMAKAVFDNMAAPGSPVAAGAGAGAAGSAGAADSAAPAMKRRFTVGIDDDVTHLSLPLGPAIHTFPGHARQCVFYGFGSDGTVGANKQAARIVGDHAGKYAQDYAWFDSRKSGGLTISYLRVADAPIHSPYLIDQADYVACHKDIYASRRDYPLLDDLREGGTFVLNSAWGDVASLEAHLPAKLRRSIARKKARFYNIDASQLAADCGLGARINMIMQTVFFKLADVMDFDQAVACLKDDIKVMYASKGADVVARDLKAVDEAIGRLAEIDYPASWADAVDEQPAPAADAPVREDGPLDEAYLDEVFWPMERLQGNDLPVSKFDPAGIVPPGTTALEKRGVAFSIPEWDPQKCVQCYECSFVCPHAAIRPYLATDDELRDAPEGYVTKDATFPGLDGLHLRIQVYPEDCVGCGSCAVNCPGHALTLRPLATQVDEQKANLAFAQGNVSLKDDLIPADTVPGTQLRQPLLEFSSCCAGCGETPYVKLLTQLFGDRLVIANATGCSSIWGAYMPAMPYTVNRRGHGPAWGNSLFEDNGEFGYGIHKGIKIRRAHLESLVRQALGESPVTVVDDGVVTEVPPAELDAAAAPADAAPASAADAGAAAPVASPALRELLATWLRVKDDPDASYETGAAIRQAIVDEGLSAHDPYRGMLDYATMFGKKSVWAVGGDGWAYDIGYGGLDHVLASGEDLNVLVLDTEGYSNTGGELSKATQLGSVSGFAQDGKKTPKKNLGRMLMAYGYVYVAHVCLGADMRQVITALREAEAYPGPSIVIALCPCISWGIKAGMSHVVPEQKAAVAGGYWPLWRFNPARAQEGKNPLVLDSHQPDTAELPAFLDGQNRYAQLKDRQPKLSGLLQSELAKDCDRLYEELSRTVGVYADAPAATTAGTPVPEEGGPAHPADAPAGAAPFPAGANLTDSHHASHPSTTTTR